MQLNLDPLGQMEQVKKVGKKEDENPSWKVSFQLRNTNNNNTNGILFSVILIIITLNNIPLVNKYFIAT
jgi:hypothetical protein